jgi:glycosyltransferase involved in cell wall biosynthesis
MELLRRAFVAGCRSAHAVVAPSEFGLRTADAYAGGVVSNKGFVAPNPIPDYVKFDPSNPPSHPYGGRPFLFYLSVVYWYKNHLNLVEAYRRAVLQGHDLPDLLMAGPATDRECVAELERAIEASGMRERIRYVGKVDFADIPGYLHHATVNVFPSTCETSSLVQSEILGAHGVQACSNVGPMPEVAGGTAELFDPLDPDDIARVVVRLCGDEARRDELRKLAAERAATLTVERCWAEIWKAALHAQASFRGTESAR